MYCSMTTNDRNDHECILGEMGAIWQMKETTTRVLKEVVTNMY